MRFFIYLFLCLSFDFSNVTTATYLSGKVTDDKTGEELIGANIVLSKEGVFVAGACTDFDGHYKIALDPGTYEVEVSYVGYPTNKIAGVVAKSGKDNRLDVQMSSGGVMLDEVCVVQYKVPLIKQDNTTSGGIITSEQIRNLPTKDISSLAIATAGLSVSNEGSNIRIRGSRERVDYYYVDGVRVENYLLGGTPAALENPVTPQQTISPRNPQPKISPITEPISNTEEYISIRENDFIAPVEEAFSTFSIDVDHAAYSIVRRDILRGHKPAQDAARTEEMVNYFNYEYPAPGGAAPFDIYTELGECPWNRDHQLLHIGLQGAQLDWKETPGSNLVFLIDVSGSMRRANKLDLLKPSFKLLVEQLRPEDKVSIVVYAGAAGLVLPATPGNEKNKIIDAIDQLRAGGSTAGGKGIQLAYKVAKENFIKGGNNRVILATDGDFNVGVSSQEGLKSLIEEKRKEQIFLTVLGCGYGNLKDNRLETLADCGNGNYAFIDNLQEAKKVFVNELTGTLYTIAKDVKIQVVFNPKTVDSYRLIGYENRLLAAKDFENDTKDAGELGAGHTVTALYEIIPRKNGRRKKNSAALDWESDLFPKHYKAYQKPSNRHLVTLKLRYKQPEESHSQLIEKLLDYRPLALGNTSDNYRWSAAVAGFSLLLRDSKYKGDLTMQQVKELANSGMGADIYGYREEFVKLVELYENLEMVSGR